MLPEISSFRPGFTQHARNLCCVVLCWPDSPLDTGTLEGRDWLSSLHHPTSEWETWYTFNKCLMNEYLPCEPKPIPLANTDICCFSLWFLTSHKLLKFRNMKEDIHKYQTWGAAVRLVCPSLISCAAFLSLSFPNVRGIEWRTVVTNSATVWRNCQATYLRCRNSEKSV